MKPLKFVRTEIRKPRYDPRPETSTTNNSAWRQGLFIVFEDYNGNFYDYMPRWDEIEELVSKKDEVERINRALASENARRNRDDKGEKASECSV